MGHPQGDGSKQMISQPYCCPNLCFSGVVLPLCDQMVQVGTDVITACMGSGVPHGCVLIWLLSSFQTAT